MNNRQEILEILNKINHQETLMSEEAIEIEQTKANLAFTEILVISMEESILKRLAEDELDIGKRILSKVEAEFEFQKKLLKSEKERLICLL